VIALGKSHQPHTTPRAARCALSWLHRGAAASCSVFPLDGIWLFLDVLPVHPAVSPASSGGAHTAPSHLLIETQSPLSFL